MSIPIMSVDSKEKHMRSEASQNQKFIDFD